jgi:putative Mn2+ efflux pump MntP
MSPASTALIAFAMSTDAFAAAIGKGAALHRPHWREALRTGLVFGVIEGLTPVVGWALGVAAAPYVEAWDHWIAFALLGALGLHMIRAGLAHDDAAVPTERPQSHSLRRLAMTGFATSIDAMAIGVGIALIDADIVVTAVSIALATLVMVTLGVMLGRVLGSIVGRRAEIAGGLVLIGIGSAILWQHLSGAA